MFIEQLGPNGCSGELNCPASLKSIDHHLSNCKKWREYCELINGLDQLINATKLTNPYMSMGYTRKLQSIISPTEEEMETIKAIALDHPRVRVTIETWDRT